MSEEAAKVKLPPGTIEWTFAAVPVDEATTNEAPTNARAEAPSTKRPHVDEKTSWNTCTICGILVPLLAIVIVLAQWSLPLAAKPRALGAITWSTSTPDALRPLAKTLARCGQVTNPDAIAKVSTLSRDIVQAETSLFKQVNEQVALAGGAVRHDPESCHSIYEFWNALNTTRAAGDGVGKDSRDLVRSVSQLGTLIEDAMQRARAECKQVILQGSVLARILQGVGWNKLVVLYPDADETLKDEECITRLEVLESCVEAQKHLSALAYDRKSRLDAFANKADKWLAHLQRWIVIADSVVCKAQDDVGGVDGLWATIEKDVLATWNWDV
ncbi:uncharacterized protein N0V89_011793 [Didymosphaeria variabile]|uniref:Uncharacterized protein n=1 Tax=Didymosphaeria variabile TaxID=1932322 RepID=A0A9W8XBY4_9PLEO|nr:uncharacterized protein N0V89_011793 [Didymosphaeria variabile]KAJ4345658.1 hypothetical protein N0V89_011793 [Didymosphaeria variabile]